MIESFRCFWIFGPPSSTAQLCASSSNMHLAYLNTLVRSLISLWIIGAGLVSEAARAVLLNQSWPAQVYTLLGISGMVWFLPGILTAFLAIAGTPDTWPKLLEQWMRIIPPGPPLKTILRALSIVYRTLVFRPFECPEWLSGLRESIKYLLFRRKAEIYIPPSYQNAGKDDEYWVFINGVATTMEVAQGNIRSLYELFDRPIHLCYNPTDGIIVDLLECIVGKVGFLSRLWLPEPRNKLKDGLREALGKAQSGHYKRVVLIAHSQGTIIASNALEELASSLSPFMKEYLEVYCIANCAHKLSSLPLKYLENISNQQDTVAWLGVLFPFYKFWEDADGRPIAIDGVRVTEASLWGHLLNVHYLDRFANHYYRGSRLHQYRQGHVPGAAMVSKAKTASS